MGMMKKLSSAARGAVASSKKMAPAMRGAVARMPTPTVGAVDSIEKGTPTSGRTLARMPEPTNRMGSNDPRALNNNPRGSNLPNDNRMASIQGGPANVAPARGGPANVAAIQGGPANVAPARGGLVDAAKAAKPMADQAAAMPSRAPLGGLRSSVVQAATKVKAAAKPAIGAALQKKPIGKVLGRGLVGLKKRP